MVAHRQLYYAKRIADENGQETLINFLYLKGTRENSPSVEGHDIKLGFMFYISGKMFSILSWNLRKYEYIREQEVFQN